jgi:hypothetical protein
MTSHSTHESPPSTTLDLRVARPHLADTTMFWSPACGGVARYLRDKRRWALRQAQWRHSWVVPGNCSGGDVGIDGVSIPFSGGYRFPLRRGHAARLNRMYADLFRSHRDPRHADLAAQLQEARWTVRNVEQRFSTILRWAGRSRSDSATSSNAANWR